MMWNMVLRRIGLGLILIWVVSVLIFALTQVLPGDAAEIRLGQQATTENLAALRAQLGLDQPWYIQYFTWIGNLLQGDLGISNAGGATIGSLINNRIGNTVFMTGVVTLISVPLSVALGLLAAMYPGQLLDRIITSGDGGVFPAGLLVGHVVVDRDGRLRARPSADFSRLNFLRVMRSHPGTSLSDPGGLIGPPWPLVPAAEPPAQSETEEEDETADG